MTSCIIGTPETSTPVCISINEKIPMDQGSSIRSLTRFSQSTELLKIIYLEDHEVTRLGTVHILKQLAPQVQIIEVPSISDLLGLSAAYQNANLIILSLDIPCLQGLEPVSGVVKLFPDVPVVVFSTRDEIKLIMELMRDGIVGFVLKKTPVKVIINALHLILEGETFFPKQLFSQLSPINLDPIEPPVTEVRCAAQLPSIPKATSRRDRSSTSSVFRERLTPRQQEVLSFIGKGLSNKEIAKALNISPGTIKNHVAEVLRILGASNRREAMCKLLLAEEPRVLAPKIF